MKGAGGSGRKAAGLRLMHGAGWGCLGWVYGVGSWGWGGVGWLQSMRSELRGQRHWQRRWQAPSASCTRFFLKVSRASGGGGEAGGCGADMRRGCVMPVVGERGRAGEEGA